MWVACELPAIGIARLLLAGLNHSYFFSRNKMHTTYKNNSLHVVLLYLLVLLPLAESFYQLVELLLKLRNSTKKTINFKAQIYFFSFKKIKNKKQDNHYPASKSLAIPCGPLVGRLRLESQGFCWLA